MSAPSTPSPYIPNPATTAEACPPQRRGGNASTSILLNNLGLPLAAGPDIMLSWEKDAFYAKQIHTQLKVRLSPSLCVLYDNAGSLCLYISGFPRCFHYLISP